MARLRIAEGRRSSRPEALFVFRLLALAVGCSTLCLVVPAFAQTDVNDVHITPREVEKSPEPPKADIVANTGLSAHVRPLKVDVDLVLVPVTITDPMNRLVTGLEKDNFELYEGNSAQEIRSFSSEDAPVSLGVIFDSSGSMSSKMDRAKDAVIEFFKTANPQDEFFMITFSDEPEEVSDFTSSVDEIQNKLVFAVPRRRTALLDAIYMGISKMRQAKYPKKALLIISDGGDNHSRYTENEIKSLVKEADQLYLATDEDREGEAISWHLRELLKPKIPVHRLVFHEITEEAIREALDHPRDIDDALVRAQETRRIIDRLYGYEVSPLLWRKVRPRLSATPSSPKYDRPQPPP